MKFEWDEVKNRANIRKHGFGFADTEAMFNGPFWFVRILAKTTARSGGLVLGTRAADLFF
jgi:uncharacterized DUF497 family protein